MHRRKSYAIMEAEATAHRSGEACTTESFVQSLQARFSNLFTRRAFSISMPLRIINIVSNICTNRIINLRRDCIKEKKSFTMQIFATSLHYAMQSGSFSSTHFQPSSCVDGKTFPRSGNFQAHPHMHLHKIQLHHEYHSLIESIFA